MSEEDKPYEHIQEAGEIIFLPSQWWHFIINLTDTMAVTENFVREEDLDFAVCDLALGHGISSFHDENAPILDEFAEDNISGIQGNFHFLNQEIFCVTISVPSQYSRCSLGFLTWEFF